ncbi:hypothetical protein L1987_69056 [Smallanthus sonchifolius]|uniref:Uncharacterized protein n=1 Tax=Smallanthus sonchifolius TaxID=185202 RepID=A0ACB9B5E9_9ASTR|nr:hypothetical protein L1987_69056 [Smallanthus sonchifolius]
MRRASQLPEINEFIETNPIMNMVRMPVIKMESAMKWLPWKYNGLKQWTNVVLLQFRDLWKCLNLHSR